MLGLSTMARLWSPVVVMDRTSHERRRRRRASRVTAALTFFETKSASTGQEDGRRTERVMATSNAIASEATNPRQAPPHSSDSTPQSLTSKPWRMRFAAHSLFVGRFCALRAARRSFLRSDACSSAVSSGGAGLGKRVGAGEGDGASGSRWGSGTTGFAISSGGLAARCTDCCEWRRESGEDASGAGGEEDVWAGAGA